MEFGYFTLSDNHYDDNVRDANDLVRDIVAEAVYADELGMNSVWIGEHHFNSLGVLSCPDLVLASIAARTSRVRLAPAVTVSPLHNPIRIAEQWATLDLLSGGRVDFAAGRGYDGREYRAVPRRLCRQPEHLRGGPRGRAEAVGPRRRRSPTTACTTTSTMSASHRGPIQNPMPTYVASFSQPSIELAARLGCGLVVAPFAAAMSFGGLSQVADVYNTACARHGHSPGRLMCSYFVHFYDNPEEEAAQRARQIRYYRECVIPAFPGDPATAPPSYRYFVDMVTRLQSVTAEQLTENSVLLGSAESITDTLKKVEAAGFSEVILYFNVGLKPHAQVLEEMDRFMREVAPNFDGVHTRRRAA